MEHILKHHVMYKVKIKSKTTSLIFFVFVKEIWKVPFPTGLPVHPSFCCLALWFHQVLGRASLPLAALLDCCPQVANKKATQKNGFPRVGKGDSQVGKVDF